MEDILLAAAMLAFFGAEYFAAGCFGAFLDEIFQGYKGPSMETDLAPGNRNQS